MDNESVLCNFWLQNRCGSQWPIFHSPLIFSYILKTIWWMNVILLDNKSMWHNLWLQNKKGQYDLYFFVHWFCLISWRLFDGWMSDFSIMSQCDTTLPEMNVGQSDLYFMVQWFCLIFWRLFNFWIMSPFYVTFGFKIDVDHSDLYVTVHWFFLISWRPFDGWMSYFWIIS